MNNMTTLLKREFWEHQAIWMVPASFAGVLVFMQVFGLFALDRVADAPAHELARLFERFAELGTADRRELIRSLTLGMAVPFNAFLVFIMFFYALGSLYDDRRDRSILFWKSLPVSDVETVLSKLVTVLFVTPAATLAVVAVFHVASLLIASIVAMVVGGGSWYLVWDPIALGGSWLTLAWVLFAQSLIYLPMIAWVMLASAWARKAPFLWAVGPPAGIIIIEAIYTGKTVLGSWLVGRFSEGMPLAVNITMRRETKYEGIYMQEHEVIAASFDILASGLLWSGVAIAAMFLVGAVWLRRYRAEAE